jgi:uncharacterized protein (TIGR00645 family)
MRGHHAQDREFGRSGHFLQPLATGAALSGPRRRAPHPHVALLQGIRPFRLDLLSDSPNDVILEVLSLIDVVFTGNLVLIVIFSGYENFVSQIGTAERDRDSRPLWMSRVDFGGLKQKLITSIVAISAVEVLKAFMNIDHYDTTKLGWLVGIHIVFLGSMLVVALADRLGAGYRSEDVEAPPAAR